MHGQHVSAETSCNTTSFPAGTKVSVVRDPADAARYLVVSPGQDWREATSEGVWFGLMTGAAISLLVVWIGYRALLHPDGPGSPLDQEAANRAAGTPEARPRNTASAALDRFGESWESNKEAMVKSLTNLVDMDIRLHGTILGALVIAVTGWVIICGADVNAELAYDRSLVSTQPVVNTTLLEHGGKGTNPAVRFGTQAVRLAHGLRWEDFRHIGETIPVVEDPQIPERLIPSELADSRGLWGLLMDNGPMIILWTAIVGFLGWMFIPRELAAAGEAFEVFLRRGRPKGRH
ncbi:hypothetical protein GCM10009628_31980 [Paeniglutamicibacter kerguelensis]